MCELEYLTLKATKLSAEDFKLITEVPNLLVLELGEDQFPEGSLQALKSKSLSSLYLEGASKFSLKDLEQVVKMPRLTVLTVDSSALKRNNVMRLKEINPNLSVLRKVSNLTAPDTVLK